MKKQYLLTPGPTPIPPNVAAKSSEPILHHRTKEFQEIFSAVEQDLKYVFRTKNDVLLISGSGTAAMEGAVANTMSPGDAVLVGSVGSFGERWVKIAQAYGLNVEILREELGKPVDPQKIKDALKKNPALKGVFIQHTETSTGVVNDVKTIGEIVKGTPSVLVVDAISGLAGEELHMDDWNLDVVVSGSQKGLMTAPGIAMASLSDKAWALVETSKSPKFYLDFKKIRKSIATNETPWTPPVTLFQSMREALRMIKEETIEKVWERHRRMAKATQAAVKTLGFPLFSSQPCSVLTSAKLPDGFDGALLIKKMLSDYGVSVAGGQDTLKGKIFRLAHMGFIDVFDLIVGVTALEKTLTAMGYKLPAPGQAARDISAALQ